MAEDARGCLIGALIVIGGGCWLYSHYEIKKRFEEPFKVVIPLPTVTPARPTGLVTLGTDKNGSAWKIKADSVRERRARAVSKQMHQA